MKLRLKLFCLILAFSLAANAQSLSKEIEKLIDNSLPHANIGILFQDLQTNEIIYQKNADKLFYPASCTKLFLAAALLYKFAETKTLTTKLLSDSQNYYIKFNGAPDFTTEDLDLMFKRLSELKINSIPHDIILDGSVFDEPNYLGGMSYEDLGWYYAAPSSAFVINGNTEAFDMITAKTLNGPVEIIPKSKNNALKIINNLKTASKDEAKNICDLNILPLANNVVELQGCVKQYKDPITVSLAIPYPEEYIKAKILAALQKYNITLNGKIIKGHVSNNAKIFFQQESKPLKELIKHMLLESDNLYAANFTKLLGNGHFKQGAYAIKTILKQYTPLDTAQIEIKDGVGTRFNLASPYQLVNLLNTLFASHTLEDSLPRMGVSGTLKDRMQNTKLANMVYAKTGSMHDISALAGYLFSQEGRIISFAIITNGINAPLAKAKKLEDEILLAVADNAALVHGS